MVTAKYYINVVSYIFVPIEVTVIIPPSWSVNIDICVIDIYNVLIISGKCLATCMLCIEDYRHIQLFTEGGGGPIFMNY